MILRYVCHLPKTLVSVPCAASLNSTKFPETGFHVPCNLHAIFGKLFFFFFHINTVCLALYEPSNQFTIQFYAQIHIQTLLNSPPYIYKNVHNFLKYMQHCLDENRAKVLYFRDNIALNFDGQQYKLLSTRLWDLPAMILLMLPFYKEIACERVHWISNKSIKNSKYTEWCCFVLQLLTYFFISKKESYTWVYLCMRVAMLHNKHEGVET